MTILRWDRAVDAGVVTETEADLLRECVHCDEDGVWHVTTTGLSLSQAERLERAILWFTSDGAMQ